MEVRARHFLIGLFVLAMITVGFVFVYWLKNVGGLGERTLYRVRFEQAASGLRPGSAVLFNGIRVGEVTDLRLSRDNPKQVMATIAVDRNTPVRADTQVGVEIQGLMGSPAVALKGGEAAAPPLGAAAGTPPLLSADAAASQDTMQAAREVLRRIDKILAENADPLRNTMANLSTFSDALARNSGGVDKLVEGLTRMFVGPEKTQATVYDLTAPRNFPDLPKPPAAQLGIADPTAVLALDTQKIVVRGGEGEQPSIPNAQWSDNTPKLILARLIQSFENANYMAVSRASDNFTADRQLAVDIRKFWLSTSPSPSAEVELGAKIVSDGRIVEARVFRATAPAKGVDAASAAAALDKAFNEAARELVVWTLGSI